jgi:hypothetical protein
MYIYNYFHAILPRNDSSASEFDSLFMSYMRIDDCDEKIIMFCDRIEKRFECSNDEKNNDKVERLKKLICFVSSKYEKEGVSGRLDVKMDKEGVDILMFEIESMYKIKEFLNTKNISKESYHVNKHFPIEKLPSAINYYSDHKATLEIGELTKGVNDILSYICDNECEITSADYDKLEAITAWRCEQVGSTNGAYWRQDLIYIKNNLIKSLNKDYGEFQRSLKPKE